jgi:predicted glycosyltransferase
MTKRIALYWHNGRGLGHTVRSATLGQALLDAIPGSAVIGITGASKGFELLPSGMDLVKIPSYLAYDEQDGVHTEPILPITKGQFQHIRENLVATFVRDFSPEVFIVDYHPEGKKGELVPAIINSPNTKKILGLRGVLNTPVETNSEFFNPRTVDFIQEYFSAIHVYTDAHVFRLEEYYGIPASLRDLLKYTGYVTRPTVATRAEARAILNIDPNARIIVASFGGGQATEKIWLPVLNSLSPISNRIDFAYFAAGPYLEPAAYERLHAEVSRHANWHWTRLLDPLPLWIKASDFFIGSGGYNSLAEVVATGANALIIPRHLSDREQEIHASRLADMKVLRVISLETLWTKNITSLLEMCLAEPYPYEKHALIAVDGARQNASFIKALIS